MLIVGGLADAFDGIVAPVQNKTSRFGDFLDHFADRVSDTVLLTGWLLGNSIRAEIALTAVIAVLLNGYIGTQLEATFHERNYDTVGRGEFVLALVNSSRAARQLPRRTSELGGSELQLP